jgi:hypothetical protein
MMNHHHAERFPLDPKIWKNLNKTDFHYLSAITGQYQTIPVSELFRSEYPTDGPPSPPPITLYTYITLKTAYILFGAFFVVYALLLLLIKTKISDRFASASWGEKLQHLIDVVNVPDPYKDWDSEENLEIRMQAKLWKSTLIEMFVMIGLQLLTNLLLLTPFWIAAFNVSSRHELLLETLGYVFPEEEHAYWLVNYLSWVLPTVIVFASVVDTVLVSLYMNLFHPWIGILSSGGYPETADTGKQREPQKVSEESSDAKSTHSCL